MKKVLLALIALAAFASAHVESGGLTSEQLVGAPDPMNILWISAAVIGIASVYAIAKGTNMPNRQKKAVFLIIAIPAVLATAYLGTFTVLLNLKSESGGPVHWHADYEVWACGERLHLIDPQSALSSYVGTSTLHEHRDSRIHVEGVLVKLADVDLTSFFRAVGGDLSDTMLVYPTNSGLRSFGAGEKCPGGGVGSIYVFVNGKLEPKGGEYVIKPFRDVPPGDRVKIVFTDKPLQSINPDIGGAP